MDWDAHTPRYSAKRGLEKYGEGMQNVELFSPVLITDMPQQEHKEEK